MAVQHYIVHVSADNGFRLTVNWRFVGTGPALGTLSHWHYETYDLAPMLHHGTNAISAMVWNGGPQAPMRQISDGTAFVLDTDPDVAVPLRTDATIQKTSALILSALETEPAGTEGTRKRGGLVQTILDILKKARGWHPGFSLHFDNTTCMPLVIEAMDESGPYGLPALSVAHNGDLMRDPEMCFELGLAGGVHLKPFYYRHDYIGCEQRSGRNCPFQSSNSTAAKLNIT